MPIFKSIIGETTIHASPYGRVTLPLPEKANCSVGVPVISNLNTFPTPLGITCTPGKSTVCSVWGREMGGGC